MSLDPVGNQRMPPFRYARTPSGIMPAPELRAAPLPPQPGLHDAFELRVATDDATEADAFRVRWQVYCDELGYEPADAFPDRREHDEDDLRSVHIVAYDRPAGRAVGCYRLLLADPRRVAAPFHLERVCGRLDPRHLPGDGVARLGFAEVSRFCVLAPYRCQLRVARDGEGAQRPNVGSLMWLSAAHLAVHLRLDYVLALMEPRLHALARSLGIGFEAIGAAVSFRGTRSPYRIDRRALRALLDLPATVDLLAPAASAWEAQAARHPLLSSYVAARPVPASQRLRTGR